MMFQWWPIVYDADPTLEQHWFKLFFKAENSHQVMELRQKQHAIDPKMLYVTLQNNSINNNLDGLDCPAARPSTIL